MIGFHGINPRELARICERERKAHWARKAEWERRDREREEAMQLAPTIPGQRGGFWL